MEPTLVVFKNTIFKILFLTPFLCSPKGIKYLHLLVLEYIYLKSH